MNSNKRVYDALKETGLPVAHMAFSADSEADAPKPPFMVFIRCAPTKHYADDEDYVQVEEYEVELYQSATSRATEKTVEDCLKEHFGFFTNGDETYIEEEGLIETVYTVRFLSDNE